MSTPRTQPGGPADATADIAQRAWEGTVVSAVVVPMLQLILLELVDALQPVTNSTLAGDPITILSTTLVVLGLLPLVSTLISTAVAYAAAGWFGVVLYYVISTGASMMLGAELTGVVIFMTGLVLFVTVAAINAQRSRKRKRPPRPV